MGACLGAEYSRGLWLMPSHSPRTKMARALVAVGAELGEIHQGLSGAGLFMCLLPGLVGNGGVGGELRSCGLSGR